MKTNGLFLSYNIQFIYEYYAIEKQEIFRMIRMRPLRLAVVPVSCNSFEKLVQSSQSPTFIRKFLNKFFCSITFKTYKFSINNRSLLLKHMFTPNCYLLPSNDTNSGSNLIFVAESHVQKHCGDVCNDVILML